MQDKGQPLNGREGIQHHKQCQPDRVSLERLVLWVDAVGLFWHARVQGLFPP
ncbi:hypothetical protein SAMN04489726_4493 [Allokutzneria albata]|uniref:Uncharacterized protein n=1 Tax=Allokutzneria albata TaxID=211114 RepID=A0A1G9XZ49_ALLAB|nr:hypothetical protein SAMN04489726_4493 [Allokutzneria albata]